MDKIKFRIRLKHIHDKTGLTAYAVSTKVSSSQNTVRKYVDVDEVIQTTLYSAIIELCNFYGVDWRDPNIVEVLIENDEDNEEGIQKRHFPRKFPDRPVSAHSTT